MQRQQQRPPQHARRPHHQALKPPPASHSADSLLAAGMQRLSISDRRGLATTTPGSSGVAAAAHPRRRVSGGGGSGFGSGNIGSGKRETLVKPGQVNSLADVASLLNSGRVCRVVVMAGAGISTASGIPDFRTPGTGLYDNLQHFRIPYPEAIFDLDYFFVNPKPFFALAKELYPSGRYRPNLVHTFCRLLHDKGILARLYTQNIDGLERQAGIPAEKLVEAHGTFANATCTHCCRQLPAGHVRPQILRGEVPVCGKLIGRAGARGGACPGILKPDIVFFGEDLPARFYHYLRDFAQCDLLIVLGTSLQVEPFAGIVDSTRLTVPRVLINRDPVGPFRGPRRRRPNDVASTGDLVERVTELARLAGWSDELATLADRIKLDIDASPDPFEPAAAASDTATNGGHNNANNNSNNGSVASPTTLVARRLPVGGQQQQHRAARTSVAPNAGRLLPPLPPGPAHRRSETTTAAAAAAVRARPGVPLFYRYRRSLSQRRCQRSPSSSSSGAAESSADCDEESSASSSTSGE